MLAYNSISTDSGNPTAIDFDTYKYVGITGSPVGNRYASVADGSYNGQELVIEKLGSGGTNPNIIFATIYNGSTDSNDTNSSGSAGRFVWNSSAWVRISV